MTDDSSRDVTPGATTATYPSELAPPIPRIEVDLAEGWEQVTVPGALMGICARRRDQFAPNIVVTWARYSLDYPLEDALGQLIAALRVLPQAQVLPTEYTELGGLAVAGTGATFVDEAAGTVAQVHLLSRVSYGTCVDIVHLTGTVGGDRVDDDLPIVLALMSGVRIGR
ncbi:MAG: hypothetical protein ACYDGN_12550 [Acidimicrobiales bacterium]